MVGKYSLTKDVVLKDGVQMTQEQIVEELNNYENNVQSCYHFLLDSSVDFEQASEIISEWGAYACTYFQEKYDLWGDINKFNVLSKICYSRAKGLYDENYYCRRI